MRPFTTFTTVLITAILCIFLLASAGLYTRFSGNNQSNPKNCADCISYALHVDDMIRNTNAAKVRGNVQFFRYAVDVACRGRLLASGRCLTYRSGFLKDPQRFSYEIEDPYEACCGIEACG